MINALKPTSTRSTRPTRALIISADDFGFTRSINRGIMEAVEAGAVTAVSMMTGQPGWLDAVQRARAAEPTLDVGLHLNLSVGSPLTSAPSLTDRRTGAFLPPSVLVARALSGRVRARDAYAECCAQLEMLRDTGLAVSHLDGHKHLHLLPGVWTGVVAAARTFGCLTIRVPREHQTTSSHGSLRRQVKPALLRAASAVATRGTKPPVSPPSFVGAGLQARNGYLSQLHSVIHALPPGATELMTHPGYVNGPLPGDDRYGPPRELELHALMAPELREWLEAAGVALTTFRALQVEGTRGGAKPAAARQDALFRMT